MGAGVKAWWLTLLSGGVIALVGGVFSRWVGGLSRRTSIDQMYMERLKTVEAQLREQVDECDQLRTLVQTLREQHVIDMPWAERARILEQEVIELKSRLRQEQRYEG